MLKIVLLWTTCLALATATILITSPLKTDFTNNQLDYKYANFGQIPYGKTLSFDLQVITRSLCGNVDDMQHFTKPTYAVIKINHQETCSYTKRALNAQAKGASGVIIATQSYEYSAGSVFQGDDGNGKKVHITTLFISNPTFDKLKNLRSIEIIAKYPIPKESVSTLSIFISAAKRNSYVFLREFQDHYFALSNFVTLKPIYHTIVCEGCSPDNCLFDKYCCFDFQDYSYNKGEKIIREQLHQYAIFNQRGAEKWFNYMSMFDDYCMGDWENVDQCTAQIMKKINLTDANMGNPSDTLSSWNIYQTKLGFESFPEVAINNMIYRGNFDTDQIVDALCESLIAPPDYCFSKNKEAEEAPPTNNHLIVILVVCIVSLTLVIIIVIVIYRKFIKRQLTNDMSSRVGELVANYASKVSKQKIRQREKLIQENDEQL